MSETTLVNETLLLLSEHCGDYLTVWRQNTGAVKVGDRFVRYGIPGQADITGIIGHRMNIQSASMIGFRGWRVEIECKTLTGRLRASQKAFRAMIERHGGVYLVIRSPGEALARILTIAHQRGLI